MNCNSLFAGLLKNGAVPVFNHYFLRQDPASITRFSLAIKLKMDSLDADGQVEFAQLAEQAERHEDMAKVSISSVWLQKVCIKV